MIWDLIFRISHMNERCIRFQLCGDPQLCDCESRWQNIMIKRQPDKIRAIQAIFFYLNQILLIVARSPGKYILQFCTCT